MHNMVQVKMLYRIMEHVIVSLYLHAELCLDIYIFSAGHLFRGVCHQLNSCTSLPKIS